VLSSSKRCSQLAMQKRHSRPALTGAGRPNVIRFPLRIQPECVFFPALPYRVLYAKPMLLPRLVAALAAAATLSAQPASHPIPRIVTANGRHTLLVDNAPYLILGAQVNNSSAWPAALPKVWPAIADIHANTVEMPVYWEQVENEPGVWGGVRDDSPQAELLYETPSPAAVLAAVHKSTSPPPANRRDAFGEDAG
jgi:hypothetical protein